LPLRTELTQHTDSLQIDSISPPIKTPYGYFLIKRDSIQNHREVPFDAAQQRLVILATYQKWNQLDSILETRADSIYQSNTYLNRVEDTLRVIASLSPFCSGDTWKKADVNLKSEFS
jgi:hypothetical protein